MQTYPKQEKLLLIHGANSTPLSFNYILSQIPEFNNIQYLNYDTNNGFYFNLESMISELNPLESYKVLSHSMGGMYAMHLLNHVNISKAVSIATPFGGASIADWARYMMPMYQLFRDVSTRSLPVRQIKDIEVQIPWTQIVTTRGNLPWIPGENDGVVTKTSMTSKRDIQYTELNCTHHEVMFSEEAVTIIKNSLL
jgi:pimeloyl-ACP methyl ester carboxylesterase